MIYRPLLSLLMAMLLVAPGSVRGDAQVACNPTETGCQAEPAAGSVPPTLSAPGGEDSYNMLGSPDAPVAMVEFSDLQCPYCARYARETFPQIKREYIDTGKVRYVVSDFPLPMHPGAIPAAVAARCAGKQGRYWAYREAVYAGLSQFAPPTDEELAQKLGLDIAAFDACRRDPAQQAAVLESRTAARQSNVASTPTFFIGRFADDGVGTKVLEGARPYAEFAAAIDAALAAGR